MIVAVTMRTTRSDHGEVRDALAHDWHARLAVFGVDLVLVPNVLPDPVGYARRLRVTHLLLTGGDNLGDSLDQVDGRPDTPRDTTEFRLLDWASADRVPTLGVCRGLQTINVYHGGGVCRAVKAASGENHVASTHPVLLENGQRLEVNSFHDQGVLLDQVGAPLHVFARTEAGVVEGLRHPSLPMVAVQWHPERTAPTCDWDDRLIAQWLAPGGPDAGGLVPGDPPRAGTNQTSADQERADRDRGDRKPTTQ